MQTFLLSPTRDSVTMRFRPVCERNLVEHFFNKHFRANAPL
jgi:hypothetical protein